jgi:hypothetical protein
MSMHRRVALAVAGTAAGAACLTGLASPASASTAPTPSARAAACDRAPWEAKVQGLPSAYHPGAAGGDYLWHDSNGFHLRVTHHSTERFVYSGQIVSPAPMRKDAVQLEGKDVAALSADRRVLTFRFLNYGHTDGINFHTDCAAALTVRSLRRDGARMLASHVYLGAKSVHPAQIPFVVHRMPVTQG